MRLSHFDVAGSSKDQSFEHYECALFNNGKPVETAHLLRSPKNAERLLTALARARSDALPATPVSDLQKRLGLDA